MSTANVQLFWETEQKRYKSTIKVRELIVLTFPTAIGEVSSINFHCKEVFVEFNSKTFEPLTFCSLFFKWFVYYSGVVL